MTARTADIVPGARLVVGRAIHCAPRDLSGMVSEFDVVTVREDETGLFFVNRGGGRRDFEPNRDPYSTAKLRIPSEVVWTIPVPEATDEELRRLVTGAIGLARSHGSDKPLLLHVQSVHEGVAYALPVLPKGDDRNIGSICPRDEGIPDYVVGNAAIWAHMLRIERKADDWALRPGALVVAWTGKAHVADGLPVHTVRYMIDVLACSVERLGQWLPQSLSPVGYYSGPFHDVHEIEEEELRARLRTEPDEALVLGYMDGDRRAGMLLGRSGITFHHADDALASMFGSDDPPLGLWVAEDTKWAGEGEDVQIDFDLRPADMADVERFGWDADDIRIEIAGDHGVPVDLVPEDICAQILEQAREVDALERWEDAIRKAWTDTSAQLSQEPRAAYTMRYPMQDFVSMARSRLCAIEGLDLAVGEDRISMRWPGASIEVLADGETVVSLPDGVRSYPPNTRVDRQDIFQPMIDWLTARPEHAERTRPDDPRTVMPVRDDA
jgi:hypothetical protein